MCYIFTLYKLPMELYDIRVRCTSIVSI